jgi:hypothetical protein
MKRLGLIVLVLVSFGWEPASADDPRLIGAWKAMTYTIGGTDYPMDGAFIFTARYYAATIRFQMTKGPADDANGNSGPYTADGRTLVFTQWVQLHLRPGDQKEPIMSRKGPDERAIYTIDGTRLIIVFPSKNRYVLERLE